MELQKAYFAGGCFWCTEAVYTSLTGVVSAAPGYIGGHIKNPAYKEVCTGRTGHAEAVEVIFDPTQISYDILVQVFFATHDPTTLNRQGNDVGTQYRSGIYYLDASQQERAEKYLNILTQEAVFDQPIVTEILPVTPFYPAEEEHKNYFNRHPEQMYCAAVIAPKLDKFRKVYQSYLK